jgi:hypothetical protein
MLLLNLATLTKKFKDWIVLEVVIERIKLKLLKGIQIQSTNLQFLRGNSE